MRASLIALVLVLGSAAVAPAQFIHDLRRPGPPPPVVRGPRFLPIQVDAHRVDVKIVDGVAKTQVNLVFRNPNGLDLEGTFMFPMPDGAAVSGFAMSMGGKLVPGEVLEKERAASIYRGIVERQRDPALLEYVGRSLFQAKVFPIPASGTTEIELRYDEPLRRDGNTLEFRYPLRTRGITGGAVGKVSVAVGISSGDPLLTIYSPSHPVDLVKKGDHEAKASFERGQEPADKDFVLVFGLAKTAVGATLFTHAEKDDEGAFLLLLAPSSDLGKDRVLAKDVVFVVDTSGSMAGDKIEQTRRALTYCLNSLGADDRFNLVPFATDAQPLFEGLVAADADHRTKALDFVRSTMIARGGTNINDALVSALGMGRDKGRPFMVIFMTDGEPTIGTTNTEAILKNVKTANTALTRLFVFGVGEELRVDLLDLLAEQNHGARDYVGTKEDIEARISSFFEKVSSPVLTDVSVEFERIRVADTYPRQLPDLFRGAQLLVTGRFTGTGTGIVRLRGKAAGQPIEHVFELGFKKGGEDTAFVPRLWAVRKVGYLLDQIRLNGENKELKDEVVRLGKTYGIVTPYTSYLVVEDTPIAGTPRPRPEHRFGFGGGQGGGVPGGGGGGASGAPGGVAPADRGEPLGGVRGGLRGGRTATADAPAAPAPDTKAGGERGAEAGKASELVERLRAGLESAPGESRDADKDRRKVLGVTTGAEAEAKNAADKLKRDYDSDPIALSKTVKALRESRSGDDGIGGVLVTRVGSRTFYVRADLTVEAQVFDLSAEELAKRLLRIEAFSKEYLDLVVGRADLAKILALGERVVFLDGDRVIQIVPAKDSGG